MSPGLALLVERIGPYHHARLSALAGRLGSDRLRVIEVASTSSRYAWAVQATSAAFSVSTLFSSADYAELGWRRIARTVHAQLDALSPECVAINGWGFAEALVALRWARTRRRGVVLMSDSQERDAPRSWLKELIKSLFVRRCHAALVAGSRAAEYVERLGMGAERVVQGYDVVDNPYFVEGAARARQDAVRLRAKLGLPERYFLCAARFIPKKGLKDLLRAYAEYRRRADGVAWELVLMGDGPLRGELCALAEQLGIREHVKLPGFVQYPELPAYYGLALAFVLPSTSDQWGLGVNEAMASGLPVLVSRACGCEPDLVVNGVTGYGFEPGDVNALADLLLRLASQDLAKMGESAQRHISRWTPHTFAENMQRAMHLALSASGQT